MGIDVVLNSEGKEHKVGFIIRVNVSKTFPVFKGYFYPFGADIYMQRYINYLYCL